MNLKEENLIYTKRDKTHRILRLCKTDNIKHVKNDKNDNNVKLKLNFEYIF